MRRIVPETKFDDGKIIVQDKKCEKRPCVISGETIDECDDYVEIGNTKYCNDPCSE